MTFLLDTNLVSYFLRAQCEDALMTAARECSLAAADEVVAEQKRSARYGARFTRWFAVGEIRQLDIVVGSAVAALFRELMAASPERGKGEHASIALAAHDESLVVVTNDKNAIRVALDELHSESQRVVTVAVFLRRMRERAHLPGEVIDLVMDLAYSGRRRPTWWADWRKTL